jgi:Sulfotransferase domain
MTGGPRPSTGTREPVRLAVWSGPRNISTAMMRAWENRQDTVVVDEPLYAHYLAATGVDHPGRDDVLAAQPNDWESAVAGLFEPLPTGVRIHYQKHMTHHLLPGMDRTWIPRLRNVMLIRDPAEVVASYLRSRPTVTPSDIGLRQQVELYEMLHALGAPPPILEAGDFLRDPEGHLRWVCEWIGVDFTPRMLSWPAGGRDTDGVWAPHWYATVRRSTGFEPWQPKVPDLRGPAAWVADACRPEFARLYEARLVLNPA